jgi:quinol monooxygenase YgiN
MSEVVVVAKLVPREGQMQTLLDVLNSLVPRVHAEEPGCLLYAPHVIRGQNDGPIVMIEKFASMQALEEHGATPAMIEHEPKLAAVLGGPVEVTLLDPLTLGDASQRL